MGELFLIIFLLIAALAALGAAYAVALLAFPVIVAMLLFVAGYVLSDLMKRKMAKFTKTEPVLRGAPNDNQA